MISFNILGDGWSMLYTLSNIKPKISWKRFQKSLNIHKSAHISTKNELNEHNLTCFNVFYRLLWIPQKLTAFCHLTSSNIIFNIKSDNTYFCFYNFFFFASFVLKQYTCVYGSFLTLHKVTERASERDRTVYAFIHMYLSIM